ncbi:MAG: hypothetical protein DMG32_13860 [Acidobacteria bacterium]|nr:MAG: hypothetical protein DMG32_13860 [Acidobacteriota bacterium]
MDDAERHLPIAEIERWLLAALCAPAPDRQTRAEILERLAAHTFAIPDHEVIFRALVKMPHATAKHIRETLSARLTRLGFPDIDVEPIFGLAPPSAEKIRTLLHLLGR